VLARSAAVGRACLACLALATVTAVPSAASAQTDTSATQRLVRAYSPILMLREQRNPPCDITEEQFQPSSVDVVLGNPRVRLVQATKRGFREITNGPTAAEIGLRVDCAHLWSPHDHQCAQSNPAPRYCSKGPLRRPMGDEFARAGRSLPT
jgi:hypothetical protein